MITASSAALIDATKVGPSTQISVKYWSGGTRGDPVFLFVLIGAVLIVAFSAWVAVPSVSIIPEAIVAESESLRHLRPSGAERIDRRHVITFLIGASVTLLLLYFVQQLRYMIEILFTTSGLFSVIVVIQQVLHVLTADRLTSSEASCWSRRRHIPKFMRVISIHKSSGDRMSTLHMVSVTFALICGAIAASLHLLPRLIYMLTGHGLPLVLTLWPFQNLLAASICIVALQQLRLDSWKIASYLLCGALLYDVFWVFLSSQIFDSSVMVAVASGQSSTSSSREALPLPALLLFPRLLPQSKDDTAAESALQSLHLSNAYQRFIMLGLGDIVLPGVWCVMMRRYDSLLPISDPPIQSRFFRASLMLYALALCITFGVLILMEHGQPALLYIVPLQMLIWIQACRLGLTRKLWNSTVAELEVCDDDESQLVPSDESPLLELQVDSSHG